MDFHLRKAFKSIKLYSNIKKKSKLIWKMALWHYYRNLFRKSLKAFRIEKIMDFKNFWFQRLASRHYVIREKERLIREKAEKRLKKVFLEQWYEEKIVHENYSHLVSTMINFSKLKIKSRVMKAFSKNRIQMRNIKLGLLKKSNKWIQSSFDQWITYARSKKIKKILSSRAYGHYYNALLSKSFNNWLPGCIKVREYEKFKQVRDACFIFWKKKYIAQKNEKIHVADILETKIKLKTYFNSLRNRTSILKRIKVGIKFRKFKLMMAWRLYSATKKFTKQNTAKAILYYKWTKLRKYFEKLKRHEFESKERQSRNETELEILDYEKRKKKMRKYFYLLKRFLVIKHVDVLRNNRILQKTFTAWADDAHFEAVTRRKYEEFTTYKRYKLKYKSFYGLKDITLRDIQRNSMIIEASDLRKKSDFFKAWFKYILYERKKRELRGLKLYKEKLLRTTFYTLKFQYTKIKRERTLEKKLDWFIEKKITRLFKGIFREWKYIVEFEKKSVSEYLQELEQRRKQYEDSLKDSRSQQSIS